MKQRGVALCVQKSQLRGRGHGSEAARSQLQPGQGRLLAVVRWGRAGCA